MTSQRDRPVGLGGRPFNSVGLRFDTADDAFDFANKIAQDGHCVARERGFSCAKDYVNDRCEIYIKVAVRGDARNYKLIAKVVPLDGTKHCNTIDVNVLGPYHKAIIFNRYSDDALMFAGACQVAHGVQDIIPSIIWLERDGEIDEIWMHRLAVFPDHVGHVDGAFGKGKVNSFAVGSSKGNCHISECLIEAVPQIGQGSMCKNPKFWGQPLPESHLNDLISGVGISVANDVVSATLDEVSASRFEVIGACFSVCDE
jgi:hypothetical protein